jgi:hypothetical protein
MTARYAVLSGNVLGAQAFIGALTSDGGISTKGGTTVFSSLTGEKAFFYSNSTWRKTE